MARSPKLKIVLQLVEELKRFEQSLKLSQHIAKNNPPTKAIHAASARAMREHILAQEDLIEQRLK